MLSLKFVCVVVVIVCYEAAATKVEESNMIKSIVSDVKRYGERKLHEIENWEVMKPSKYPYFNVFPALKGTIYEKKEPISWKSKCFDSNIGEIEISNDRTQILVKVQSMNPVRETLLTKTECLDFYLVACTSTSVDVVISPTNQEHVITQVVMELPSDITDAEWFDIDNKGIRVSLYPNDPGPTFANLLETVALFSPDVTDEYTEKSNSRVMEFMNEYTNFDPIVPADPSSFTLPDESEIHSGDFFGLLKLSGIGAMMGWATGSTTGHTFVAQWMNEKLYMCESTTPAVQCTVYNDFMDSHRHSSQIVWAPLKKEYRDIYNETAAEEFFHTVEGIDYGFRTLLYGWMDDEILNLPCLPPDFSSNCGTWSYFETSLAEIDRKTSFGEMIWNPGIAKRLNVSDQLRTSELYMIAAEQGLDMVDVFRVPEQDSWLYNTTRYGEPFVGKDMVCDVFVCNMWKAAGLFGSMEQEINCGEMVNWDVYAIDFLEPTYTQIMGNHTLKLQFDYASKSLYPHMAESCSTRPPDYVRDPNC